MDLKDMPQQSQMDHVSVNGKRSGSFPAGVSKKYYSGMSMSMSNVNLYSAFS